MKDSVKNIQYTSAPASADIDFLTQKINQETPEFGEAHPFAFFIRDKENQLWVHPAHRRNGLGYQLMEAVETYGRRSGCSIATVATMSFQGAKAFYEKLGYVSDFERPGYTQNSSCYFMRKML